MAADGGVQTPVGGERLAHVRPVPATLVGDDRRPGECAVLEYLVNRAGATERGKEHERLVALTQHGAACRRQGLHGGDARHGSDLEFGSGLSNRPGQVAEGGIDAVSYTHLTLP